MARRLAGRIPATVAAAVMALAICAGSAAAKRPYDDREALRISQETLGARVGAYEFITTERRRLRLADLAGKPVVVSLIYTSCADVCPTVSETLAEAVAVAQDALGADSFHVVSIGFDWRRDTPDRMRAFARSHGLHSDNWRFLSADGDTIDRLSADLGFQFFAAPQGFDHLTQTSILDPEGRIHTHLYGETFDPPLLVEPLKDLILGRMANLSTVSGVINRVRLFCTIYDPNSGRYHFDYNMLAMIAGGSLSLATIGFVLVRAWIQSRPPRSA